MTSWNEIRNAIDAKDPGQVMALVAKLDDTGRRKVAAELPGRLRELRAKNEWGFLDREFVAPLVLAGAGTIGGAAAAASWLCRRPLVPWSNLLQRDGLGDDLMKVTAARPAEWRAEVGRRIAGRISGVSDRMLPLWHMSAALTRSAGADAPASDGFVVGWAIVREPAELADDPFLGALVPRLFEADGVGAVLADDDSRDGWDRNRQVTWAEALVDLADSGRLDRAMLLDGCIGRFLRGGTARDLRWFVRLHDALEPTDNEAAARVRDYVRLLPSAPPAAADLALRQIRRTDDLEPLNAALFEEAAEAVLFRTEKKLVRTALTWLDRTARKHDRVDPTVRAITAVFTSNALDLRERAVKIAVKHVGRTSEDVRKEVCGAAADLPPDLLETIAAAYGAVATAAPPVSPGPPPFVPRTLPAPIASLAELAEAFVAQRNAWSADAATERFLAALVEAAYTDPAATRDALRRHRADQWRSYQDYADHPERTWASLGAAALLEPPVPAWFETRGAPTTLVPLRWFLLRRKRETATLVGKVPVLLATPTEGSGHVEAMVLAERLERLEQAGSEPGRMDLAQALLRVPREVDPDAVTRAKGLVSEAGRTLAAHLASGGLPDPVVECVLPNEPFPAYSYSMPEPPPVHVTTVTATGTVPARLSGLWNHHGEVAHRLGHVDTAPWPMRLPSHREVTAAHILPHVIASADYAWDVGSAALALAEADGPAGRATGAVLALALAHEDARERADAVEAFLVLGARGQLPAAEVGAAIGRFTEIGRIKPNRAVRALTEAADAGAHADAWTVIAAALPHLLPEPGSRAPSGLPDLVALGARTAEIVHARGTVPGLAEAAARGGSSRTVKEAAHLVRVLART